MGATGNTNPIHLLTFIAALGSGLVPGIFFAFSNFVMKALARLPPAQGIAAMQSMNVIVLNRWFFGTAACCLALAITTFVRWQRPLVVTRCLIELSMQPPRLEQQPRLA